MMETYNKRINLEKIKKLQTQRKKLNDELKTIEHEITKLRCYIKEGDIIYNKCLEQYYRVLKIENKRVSLLVYSFEDEKPHIGFETTSIFKTDDDVVSSDNGTLKRIIEYLKRYE